MNSRRFTAQCARASQRKDSTPQLRQEPAALRDFSSAYVRFGSKPDIRRSLGYDPPLYGIRSCPIVGNTFSPIATFRFGNSVQQQP